MEKVAGIAEYYAEKAGEEFKESALSDATELEVGQWQENRKNLGENTSRQSDSG